MVTVTGTTPYSAYRDYRTTQNTTTYANAATAHTTQAAPESTNTPAASVTLSDAALASMAERDYVQVIADTQAKLSTLLTEAGRTSPLKSGRLALDISSLDQRELYALANAANFSSDEHEAAGLEMERRLNAALAGPAAIANVTGDYTGLYKAAATYLDGLSAEEKESDDWKAGRAALTKGLEALKTAPGTLPSAGEADPVRIYLALSASQETITTPIADLATNTRNKLDTMYAQAYANGKVPSFNRATKVGTYIDISEFSSRVLSAMVLDTAKQFSSEEVFAAKSVLSARSSATLSASFASANKSGDPTAFSRNIIAAYSSLSSEERLAVGWSDKLYQAAMSNYVSTTKLLGALNQAVGATSSGGPTAMSLLGR